MKTVLIITYYWPPAGGPGVQRALKFAKYLPQFGWSPVILTVANGEYPAVDETLQKDVDAEWPVYKTASLEPFALYRRFTGKKPDDKISTFVLTEDSQGGFTRKIASFVRGNLFIPDARVGWKPFAVREGLKIVKSQNIDLIFSTAPPMSTHLIAKKLARKTGLPWVADFRDPWTDVFYYHNLKRTKIAVALDRRLEKSVLQSADAVVTVSPTIKQLFESKAANRYHVIPNGYDEDDFRDIPALADDGFFHIVHAGHLAVNQNPVGLWKALKQLGEENPALRDRLRLDFYGSIHADIRQYLVECGLEEISIFHHYVPHDELVAVMKRAGLLFFVVPDTSYAQGILTSKLFDYMGAGRPILGIGPEDGDAAEILRQTRIGEVATIDNVGKTVRFLKKLLENGTESFGQIITAPFVRRRLAQDLAELLTGIC